MKKSLLTLALAAFTAAGAMADNYTFVFDGTNDLGGMTRQTTLPGLGTANFVKTFQLSEDGINVEFNTVGSGDGFALVNAGNTNQCGILVTPLNSPQISLTVPGGHIIGAKVTLSGYNVGPLDLSFNGTSKSYSSTTSPLFFYEWSDDNNGDNLLITWNQVDFNMAPCLRYVHSIELTYTKDLGGKQEAGLAFSAETAQGFIGEEFTAPELTNPNNLPITWSSSDEAVATVDANGKVTPLAAGKTFITASTAGNDEFAEGSTRYELTVIPVANNLPAMLAAAPAENDLVKVNCPLTVTYARTSYAYVIDEDGNAGYIRDMRYAEGSDNGTTIYNVGDIIPAGWIATFTKVSPKSNAFYWAGLPAEVTETTEVTYPEVTSISPEDNYRVVTLRNVTFTGLTPANNDKAYGTTSDGKTYEFQNTYGIGEEAAGTYDVTGVVLYSTIGSATYFYMAPISYAVSTNTGIEAVETTDTDARYFNLQGIEVANPENGIFVKVAGGKASKIVK